jgi:hypothetical protein
MIGGKVNEKVASETVSIELSSHYYKYAESASSEMPFEIVISQSLIKKTRFS